jgi:hypothetical protein
MIKLQVKMEIHIPNDEDLVNMSFSELNLALKGKGISKQKIQEIKLRRRTLKLR